MILEISIDDGGNYDTKVADLLKKYDLPGMFYIPTWRSISDSEVLGLVKNGFEIGGHTNSHPKDLKVLPYPQLIDEIESNKLYLEELIGKRIHSFCYPRGRYNDEVIKVVKELGFCEARTTQVGYTDYPEDKFKKHTTAHVYSGRKEYGKLGWFAYSVEQFSIALRKNGYFHLWLHSEEVEKHNEWRLLEAFFKVLYDYKNK